MTAFQPNLRPLQFGMREGRKPCKTEQEVWASRETSRVGTATESKMAAPTPTLDEDFPPPTVVMVDHIPETCVALGTWLLLVYSEIGTWQ